MGEASLEMQKGLVVFIAVWVLGQDWRRSLWGLGMFCAGEVGRGLGLGLVLGGGAGFRGGIVGRQAG